MGSILREVNGDVAIYRFGTFCLITSLATTSQYFVLWPALETSTLPTWLTHIGLFNTGILYIYWTFYLSTKGPGHVSPKYLPLDASTARYCKKCQEFKPPRTRHCRQCNRCILKMDHHCPWLSGCVGFRNQAVFVEFLGWVVPTTGYLGIMMIRALLDIYRTTGLRTDPTFLFVVVYNMLWCISENITTVETLIKKRTDVLTRKHGLPKVDFPYDLYSVRANLREVFGPFYYYPWTYLWPVGLIAPSDGHSFRVNEDAKGNDRWPPLLPETIVNSSEVDTTSKGQQNPDVPLRRREQKRRESSGDSEDSEQDEFTYEEYSRMGLLADSDGSDSDDYPDGDDESFGADDSEEAAHMDDLIGQDNVTLAQLIESRRQKLHDATREL